MKKFSLGVIGAGNMGMAIAEGAVRAGLFAADKVLLCNRSTQTREKHAQKGFAVTEKAGEVYRNSEIVLLGVKPQGMDEILAQLAPYKENRPLVLSIAAGTTFAKLEAALGADTPMLRAMPNTPLLLGQGATALVKNAAASEKQLCAVQRIFDALGITAVFENEDMLCEIIPYAGSAPAYLYAFADAMVKSAKAHGIDEKTALSFFCKTMQGAAALMLQGEQTTGELIRAVCSPGGTTLAGMAVLEQAGFADTVAAMCDACVARAYELGRG